MENFNLESKDDELTPEFLGIKFNESRIKDFIDLLRQKINDDSSERISIIAEWSGVIKARAAKALLDQYADRLNIDSIIIRATREQHDEDVNAFQSGVEWEEIE